MGQRNNLEARVAELEKELGEAAAEKEAARVRHSATMARNRQLERQSRFLHSLLRSLYSVSDTGLLSRITAEAVDNFEWDCAFVIGLKAGGVQVAAASGATDKQLEAVKGLTGSSLFKDAYSKKEAFSTFTVPDREALLLRTSFITDEVLAVPLVFRNILFGYLFVCEHGRKKSRFDDFEFMKSVGNLIGAAIYGRV